MQQSEQQRSFEIMAQYGTLLETSIDGFFINVGGCFEYVNPAFQRMLGARSSRELLGRRVLDFIDAGSQQAVRERIRVCEESLEPLAPLEEKYIRLDGSRVDVEVTAVAVLHDERHAALVTVRDISERKRAELAQRRLEEKLRESQRMEALGTLAGGVAHDFNNILAVVVGNADLALGKLEPGHPARRHVAEILAASERARSVIAQVLAFSKRTPPERRVLDLRATVREELGLLRAALPPGVSLEERLDPGAHPVLADATQIHQVLFNLCTNAWQAFEGRPGTITIGLRTCTVPGDELAPAELTKGRYAVLSVADDGPGIDPNTRERIFEPFFTTKQPHQGTGLGLSVVHGIAKAHAARVTCTSQPGHGATFCLYLPMALDSVQSESTSAVAAPAGAGQTILFVDDEVGVLMATQEMLHARGYRVAGFGRSGQALEVLRADPQAFDLVITDLRMPGESGLDLARAVREVDPTLPIILVSGFVEDAATQTAEDLGVSAILEKPVDADELCRALARALETAPRRRAVFDGGLSPSPRPR